MDGTLLKSTSVVPCWLVESNLQPCGHGATCLTTSLPSALPFISSATVTLVKSGTNIRLNLGLISGANIRLLLVLDTNVRH